MALPGSHEYVTITAKFLDVNDNPGGGSIAFNVNTPAMVDGFELTGGSISAQLDDTGALSFTVLACDDSAFSAYNWAYTITATGALSPWNGVIVQPKYADGASQSLFTLANTNPVAPAINYAAGQQLAAVNYAPGSEQTYNINTGSLTILDGTELSVEFTVPVSGNVYVEVTMDWAFGSNGSLSSAEDMFVGLCQHGNASEPVSIQSWIGTDQPNVVLGGRATHRYYVSGLTPGATEHWDLCGGMSSTNDIAFAAVYAGCRRALSGDPTEPGLIQVFAA